MVNDQGDLINVVNPYIVKTLADGLHVCLPAKVMTIQSLGGFQFGYILFISNQSSV